LFDVLFSLVISLNAGEEPPPRKNPPRCLTSTFRFEDILPYSASPNKPYNDADYVSVSKIIGLVNKSREVVGWVYSDGVRYLLQVNGNAMTLAEIAHAQPQAPMPTSPSVRLWSIDPILNPHWPELNEFSCPYHPSLVQTP